MPSVLSDLPKTARFTDDGLPIFTEEELNIGKGGGMFFVCLNLRFLLLSFEQTRTCARSTATAVSEFARVHNVRCTVLLTFAGTGAVGDVALVCTLVAMCSGTLSCRCRCYLCDRASSLASPTGLTGLFIFCLMEWFAYTSILHFLYCKNVRGLSCPAA